MALSDALVDEIEDIVDEGVDVLNEVMADVVEALGDRPFGFAKVPRDLLLDWWIEVRDDPASIGQLIEEEAQFWGPSLALRRVLKESIQMEAMLERAGGPEAVQAKAVMRRLGEAEKALRRLEKQEALPPFIVAPPARVLSQSELLGMGAGGDAAMPMGAMGVPGADLPVGRQPEGMAA